MAHAQTNQSSPWQSTTLTNETVDIANCGSDFTCHGKKIIAYTIIFTGNTLLRIFSWITWIGGTFLNTVLLVTVVNMSGIVEKTSAIQDGWKIIRDLSNIAFIFVLLYISISTILDLGVNTGKALRSVVIAALFINFSFFFAATIIDVSNILTLHLYDQILTPSNQSATGTSSDVNSDTDPNSRSSVGLSGKMLEKLGVPTQVFSFPDDAELNNTWNNLGTFFVKILGGIFLLIVSSFIFIAAGIMFLYRFVIFVFLLIFSPIAFLGMILPQTKSTASAWWKSLTDNALFAPVYMVLTFIALEIVGSLHTQISAVANSSNQKILLDPTAFLNFVIVAAFLLGSLIISKKYATASAGTATSLAGKAVFGKYGLGGASRFAGRRIGAGIKENKYINNLVDGERSNVAGRWAGRLALRTGDKIEKGTYDARKTLNSLGSSLGEKNAFGKSVSRKDLDKNQKDKEQAIIDAMAPTQHTISQAEADLTESRKKYIQIKDTFDKDPITKKINTKIEIAEKELMEAKKALGSEDDMKKLAQKERSSGNIKEARNIEEVFAKKKSTLATMEADLSSYRKEKSGHKKTLGVTEAEEQLEPYQKKMDTLKGVDDKEALKRAKNNTKQAEDEDDKAYKKRVEKEARGLQQKSQQEARTTRHIEDAENSMFQPKRERENRVALLKKMTKKQSAADLLEGFIKETSSSSSPAKNPDDEN